MPALLRGSCGNWTWAKDNAPGKVCDSAPFAYEQLVEMEATQWSKELELEARRQSVEDGKGEVRGGLRGQGNAHLQGDSREGGLDEAGEE